MPYSYKSDYQSRQFMAWKNKVIKPDIFMIDDDYKTHLEPDTYKRMTGFINEYFGKELSDRGIPTDWWDSALKVRAGKQPENNPIALVESEYDKEKIMRELMPAYRALKESYSKRWFFEIIFNNKAYTAERDAIKAMEGLMMATTGMNLKEIDAELKAHQKGIVETAEEKKSIIESNKNLRRYLKNPDKFIREQAKAIEKHNAGMRKMGFSPESYAELPDLSPYERYANYCDKLKGNQKSINNNANLNNINLNNNVNYLDNDDDDEIEYTNSSVSNYNSNEYKKEEPTTNTYNNNIIDDDENMEMNNSINNDLQDEYVNDNSIKKNEDANEKEVDDQKEQLSVDTENDDRSDYEEDNDNYYEKLMAYMREQEAKKKEQQNENKVNISIDEEKPQVNYWDDGSQPKDIEEPRKSLQQTK